MPRRTQRGRLLELAEQIGWKGELLALVEMVTRIVNSLPPKIGDPFRRYYLDNEEIPKREDGCANIPIYQKLYEGRTALAMLGNMPVDLLNKISESKQKGEW